MCSHPNLHSTLVPSSLSRQRNADLKSGDSQWASEREGPDCWIVDNVWPPSTPDQTWTESHRGRLRGEKSRLLGTNITKQFHNIEFQNLRRQEDDNSMLPCLFLFNLLTRPGPGGDEAGWTIKSGSFNRCQNARTTSWQLDLDKVSKEQSHFVIWRQLMWKYKIQNTKHRIQSMKSNI